MQGNDINIIVVTDKVKAFAGKLGLWVREIKRYSFGYVFSFERFCGGKHCGNK
jgi:hypothetical protein